MPSYYLPVCLPSNCLTYFYLDFLTTACLPSLCIVALSSCLPLGVIVIPLVTTASCLLAYALVCMSLAANLQTFLLFCLQACPYFLACQIIADILSCRFLYVCFRRFLRLSSHGYLHHVYMCVLLPENLRTCFEPSV